MELLHKTTNNVKKKTFTLSGFHACCDKIHGAQDTNATGNSAAQDMLLFDEITLFLSLIYVLKK
jgi:hypothetical protein